jgi:hypothetical protein
MVMTHMHPGEGTWNIRLWRSAVEPGIYKLELQDPKAEGVQTGTYPMRFPSPEYAQLLILMAHRPLVGIPRQRSFIWFSLLKAEA